MNRKRYLHDLERRFLCVPRQNPAAVAQDLGQVEGVGGVYGIWEDSTLRYFGATCHLNHRLLEIVVIGRHHSLNLLMGPHAHEKTGRERSAWFCRSPFQISWLIVDIGRAEFEEYMVLKYAGTLKNHQSGRFGLRSDIAEWWEMAREPKGRANERQPFSPETNRLSAEAASRRSP